ncbi:MAG: LacI family transcriptional regulator [Ancrocorticia sp.]|jgi:DNA-binding LacI/PurR family transcriptional regulator|nr:LacI family transcriptional regulator [Ancrocorticia sp.]
MQMRGGMAEIAEAAGVAVSTVSRALSGAPGVSQAKRQEILRIARSIGYVASSQPDPVSRPARIAAVIPEAQRWIFGSILSGLHDVLSPDGISLHVRQGMSASQRAEFLTNSHVGDYADVVILVPAPRDMAIAALQALPVPVVIAGSLVDGINSVGIDDVAVGEKATNHLINLGFTRITFVGYMDHDRTTGVATLRRLQGYESRMARAGLPAARIDVPYGDNSGRQAAEILLAADSLPEGLFCASDEMAAEIMAVFRQAGVKVPGDVAIVSVDNHPIAGMMGLTTIAQPAREQGRVAARMALRILGGDTAVETVELPTHLVVRDTTRHAD